MQTVKQVPAQSTLKGHIYYTQFFVTVTIHQNVLYSPHLTPFI